MEFLNELFARNPALFVFGLVCLVSGLITGGLVVFSEVQVLGINAWIKPAKFLLSSWIFCWTMGWLLAYLNRSGHVTAYTWTVVAVMTFELVYIILKAAQGELSHFNISTPFNAFMYGMMGIAISAMTFYTLIIGYYFFKDSFPDLSLAYLWGIRLGILCFVVFAFEGGIMAQQLAHSYGGPDGGPGIQFLNWSIKYGDLRVAHFVGMHALQVLPLLGFYVFSRPREVIIAGAVYILIAFLVLIQALMKIPLIAR